MSVWVLNTQCMSTMSYHFKQFQKVNSVYLDVEFSVGVLLIFQVTSFIIDQ